METVRIMILEHGITFLIGLFIGAICGIYATMMTISGRW